MVLVTSIHVQPLCFVHDSFSDFFFSFYAACNLLKKISTKVFLLYKKFLASNSILFLFLHGSMIVITCIDLSNFIFLKYLKICCFVIHTINFDAEFHFKYLRIHKYSVHCRFYVS